MEKPEYKTVKLSIPFSTFHHMYIQIAQLIANGSLKVGSNQEMAILNHSGTKEEPNIGYELVVDMSEIEPNEKYELLTYDDFDALRSLAISQIQHINAKSYWTDDKYNEKVWDLIDKTIEIRLPNQEDKWCPAHNFVNDIFHALLPKY